MLRLALRTPGLVLIAALLTACGTSSPDLPGGSSGSDTRRLLIEHVELTESSGLARSQREDGLYWSHNDSGGPTTLYAFDAEGHARGTLDLSGALNLDWEDMAGFTENGAARLLVGDIGDNGAVRPFITLYVIDEPALSAGAMVGSTLVLRSLQVVYPDGPRDCESVAVDPEEGAIYLLSKRDAQPRLYRVPLSTPLPVVIAESLGTITIPRAPEDAERPERINWVTGMDFDPTLRRLALTTLTQVHIYTRAEGESWAQALQRAPQTLDLPAAAQTEAITWRADGGALLLTSEGSPTPATWVTLPN